jgi:hypothetical protein
LPTLIDNCYEPAWVHRDQTVFRWGKDQTGLIEYRFNSQGYRSYKTYDSPATWAFFGNSIVFGIGVCESNILTSYFEGSQNFGLAGNYLNQHSVTNLANFLKSPCCKPDTRLVFFWIDRETEDIDFLINKVDQMTDRCLHISSGIRRTKTINLMPPRDQDVSGTHPGPATHRMWAKAVRLLYEHKKNNHS